MCSVIDQDDLEWLDSLVFGMQWCDDQPILERGFVAELAGQMDGVDVEYLNHFNRCRYTDEQIKNSEEGLGLLRTREYYRTRNARIVQLYISGELIKVIAHEMRMSSGAISNIVHKLHIHRPAHYYERHRA